jgi:hypothetical protein
VFLAGVLLVGFVSAIVVPHGRLLVDLRFWISR